MWVARDKYRGLHVFKNKPEFSYATLGWKDKLSNFRAEIDEQDFTENLAWNDEPIKVELCQVFNSREHNMLNLLKKAYDIANDGSNPFNNDATGSSFCWEIKNMITPIMERIQKDIDIYDIKD